MPNLLRFAAFCVFAIATQASAISLHADTVLTTIELGDAAFFDRFGASLALSGDVAVVGVPEDDVGSILHAGSAYVFRRTTGVWRLEQKLVLATPAGQERFGSSVAIDGETIAVGASAQDIGEAVNAGGVYLFEHGNAGWVQTAGLLAQSPSGYDRFGSGVALQGDVLIASSPYADVPGFIDAGVLDVFLRQAGAWTHLTRLLPLDPAEDGLLGARIAMSETTIAASYSRVGAAGGNVQLFTFDQGVWSNTQSLTASDGAPNNGFGSSLSLLDNNLAIGSHGANGT